MTFSLTKEELELLPFSSIVITIEDGRVVKDEKLG